MSSSSYNRFDQSGTTPVPGVPVQGQPTYWQPGVTDVTATTAYAHSSGYPEIPSKGEDQPKRFNDVFWGVLFYCHLIAMAILTATYLPGTVSGNSYNYSNNDGNGDDDRYYRNDDDGDDGQVYYNNLDDYYARRVLTEYDSENSGSITHFVIGVVTRSLHKVTHIGSHRALEDAESGPSGVFLLVGLTVVCSFLLSILSLTIMIRFAQGLIKMSLFFNMAVGLAVAAGGFMMGSIEAGIIGLVLFVISACYTWAVWSRIPFAATNLVTASSAIQANMGLTFFAYGAIFANGLWLVFWSAATFSTLFVVGGCNAAGECQNEINSFYTFLFFLSLYWTIQVIKNVVHVTVAGTVGTWWWNPLEASGCCSKGVRDSHNRALTYSFGSICFGSLLVAIIQTLKQLAESAREQEGGLLRCLADCILGCLETIMEMFNEWAFVYVGLYGYSFIEASKNVITLFKSRGWTAIITDYMVDRVLMMLSFGNGLLSGACAAYISYVFNLNLEGEAFMVGFLVGVLLTSTVLGVVGSGVNTVIVCYAEDPLAFEINHYELSMRMRDTWRAAFPEQFKY